MSMSELNRYRWCKVQGIADLLEGGTAQVDHAGGGEVDGATRSLPSCTAEQSTAHIVRRSLSVAKQISKMHKAGFMKTATVMSYERNESHLRNTVE